jgi:flavin-dependent dehydrogenase
MQVTQSQFDVAVIGAGPAGSSAAIAAARFGAKVVLCEAGEFPRHKVCGEYVSAESLDILRDLLQSVPDADRILRAAPIIDQVRLLLDESTVTARVAPPALSLPRYELDFLLWQAAKQAGVQTRSNCEVRAVHEESPFQLDTSSGVLEASAVIVAPGRWSRFTPRVPIPDGPKWIGLKAHYRESQPPRSTDLYFFQHGYCGVQPVAGDIVNACAMVRSDRATSLEEAFLLHAGLAERRCAWQAIMEPVTTAPLIYRTPRPVNGQLIFIGDAAAFIDPFVGDGISIALRTGRLAAAALKPFLRGSIRLADAVSNYQANYNKQIVPLIAAASRIRALLSWPKPAQLAAFELLRLPGVMPYFIRRTRHNA